ncbi:STAS domain-containing protein [Spirillospora sp. NPDC029432]|uniref:STAS domain-containing protein n=1 Tax=Spirillospora sp. NPDC029432 TaxID=3154599 RepID=UPI0034561A23
MNTLLTRHTTTSTAVRRARARPKTGLTTRRRSGRTIVALHGDLDMSSAPALREDLIGTLHHSAQVLILDLGAVTFCDTAGLAVLVGVQRRATGLGITVHLAAPRPQIAELLRITGLDRSLTTGPEVHDARVPAPAHAT